MPLIAALVAIVALVAYALPLSTTGDPLWPLPTETRADVLVVYWDGRSVETRPGDPLYAALMDDLNGLLRGIVGIEYSYGLRPSDVDALRGGGRAVEARYGRPTRIHGPYAVGPFERILVALSGPEGERRLVFFGDGGGYRAGPLRAASTERLARSAESLARR